MVLAVLLLLLLSGPTVLLYTVWPYGIGNHRHHRDFISGKTAHKTHKAMT